MGSRKESIVHKHPSNIMSSKHLTGTRKESVMSSMHLRSNIMSSKHLMGTRKESVVNKHPSKTMSSKQLSSRLLTSSSAGLINKLMRCASKSTTNTHQHSTAQDFCKILLEDEESQRYSKEHSHKEALKPAKTPLGFGSSVPIGSKPTSHPNLDPQGFYCDRPLGCDPCLYTPKPASKLCATKVKKKDPWLCKVQLEDWSKNLGYRNQRILKEKAWFRSIGGPAWISVPEPVKLDPTTKDLGFGRTPRFKTKIKAGPGPGAYYKAQPFKAPYGSHSTRPTFEREEPCRFKDTTPSWCLPPNNYRILDKESIENKSKKIVSLRGPYDLFTGKRDNSTIKNGFAAIRCHASTWPLALPGSFEKLKKSHLGVLNKTNRDKPARNRAAITNMNACRRIPEEPGPAAYDVVPLRTFKQNKYGFNSSYDKPPGYVRTIVWPAVGRYKARNISCGILGQGHRHVFLSKVQRSIGADIPQPMNSF